MRLYKIIHPIQNLDKEIQFIDSHTEIVKQYKQSGPDYVVDFKFLIKPTNTEIINVYCSEDEDPYINESFEYITNGVILFLENINQEQISIKGFDIYISESKIHEVDFKPRMFTAYTKFAISRLAFDYGQKSINKKNRIIQVQNEQLELDLFKQKYINYDHLSKQISTGISLSNRNKEKIIIEGNHNLDKIVQFNGEYCLEIKLFTQSYEKHPNNISLYILNDINTINISYSILEGVIKFKNDIYSKGYDLGGFIIYLGNCDNEINSHSFKEYIYWELLNLVADKMSLD